MMTGPPGLGERRRDAGGPAIGRDRLPRQQPPKKVQFLVGKPAPPTEVDAEVLVLLAAVPDTERVGHPAAADDVEHRHVLGQPHRVPERISTWPPT